MTTTFLEFVRVVVDGNVDEVFRRLARNRHLRRTRLVSARHVGTRPRSSSRDRALPVCRRHRPPHGGGGLSARSRGTPARMGRIAGREIGAEPSRFTTRRTRIGGIRSRRRRPSHFSSQLARIPTPWIALVSRRSIEPSERGRWPPPGRFWTAGRMRGDPTGSVNATSL